MLSLLVLFLLTPSLLQVVTLKLKMSDYMYFQYLLKQKKIITCLSALTICGWQVPSWFYKQDKIEPVKSESIFWIFSIEFISQYIFNRYFCLSFLFLW